MIFYFSGTGNSRLAAETLARLLGDRTVAIDYAANFNLPPSPDEAIGIVLPVYGWGMPKVAADWLERLPALPPDRPTPYIYSVLTHGDDIGRTDDLLRRALRRKGFRLAAAFSVAMRNTYVCLPGFDIDSPETERRKLRAADERLRQIAAAVGRRTRTKGRKWVTPGAAPWLKTYILRPLFNGLLTSDRRFHVDEAQCIACGKCIRACPVGNLTADKNGRPEWNGRCTHCLACYHVCPRHAVLYGRFTRGKGQVKGLEREG